MKRKTIQKVSTLSNPYLCEWKKGQAYHWTCRIVWTTLLSWFIYTNVVRPQNKHNFFSEFSHLRKPAPHFFHPKASPVIFSLSVAHMYTARLFCHCLCLHNDEGAFQGGRPLNKQTWLPITPCSSGMQMSGNKW